MGAVAAGSCSRRGEGTRRGADTQVPLGQFASAPAAGCSSPCTGARVKPWGSEGTAGRRPSSPVCARRSAGEGCQGTRVCTCCLTPNCGLLQASCWERGTASHGGPGAASWKQHGRSPSKGAQTCGCPGRCLLLVLSLWALKLCCSFDESHRALKDDH